MLDKQIRKIKISFVLLASAMFFLMIWSVFALQNNTYLSMGSIFRNVNYYRYKMALNRVGIIGSIAGMSGVAKQPVVYADAAPVGHALSIPVLVYHGVLPKSDNSKINLTTAKFEEQMFALKQAGYHTVDTSELYQYLKGQSQLSAKSFVLTFDDGRQDSYDNADPILRATGFHASMAVITKYSVDTNSNYYLSSQTLKNMSDSGVWDIQAHTQDGHNAFSVSPTATGHFFADRLWLSDKKRLETPAEFENRITNDFIAVKDKLKQVTGKDVIAFTFPFGDFGQNTTNFPGAQSLVLDTVSKYFRLAFYQTAPGIRFTSNYYVPEQASSGSFLVKRIDINPDWSGTDILRILKNSQAKSLPYSDNFSSNKGWIASWGLATVDPTTKVMTIKPGAAQTGGSAVLDGSRLWKNYQLTTVVDVPNHNSVFIWARYQDDQNNAACNFGQGFAHVEQTINGVSNVIKGQQSENFVLPTGDFQVGIRVKDRQIDCLINGNVVVSSIFMDPTLSTGGIGFKTWDTQAGRSLLLVKKVEVVSI